MREAHRTIIKLERVCRRLQKALAIAVKAVLLHIGHAAKYIFDTHRVETEQQRASHNIKLDSYADGAGNCCEGCCDFSPLRI